ncbi:hypothetical protein XA68_11801 [Ophiocordyceps unilateralis]|uniref:6-methylsalicylate decarboxylase n=1 Tax=Ophiocordyceps unilateralis TaxID=268505 RepID=A0A2A9PN44_OPHUN|nr:hypothetical protein XA68_11801 [Ophiocordyceps unilateralis]
MSRIDVHHHIYPPQMYSALEAAGGDPSGWKTPEWTVGKDDEFSKSIDVGTVIYSVTAPGASVLKDGKQAAEAARSFNEYCAKLRDGNPSKYGFFLSLGSLLHVDLCLDEIRYSFDVLGADGVILFTRYGRNYLGHADFKPIWEELNRRQAVVFIHPTHAFDTHLVNDHAPAPLFDFPHETTRTAADLIMANNLREFPDCKIILSHGGGTLPYIIHRIAMVADTPFSVGKTSEEIIEDGKRFYFDLALSGSHLVLSTLLEFAKPGHVLFGSDFPNAPKATIERLSSVIDNYKLSPEARHQIHHGAAVALFPRLRDAYKA